MVRRTAALLAAALIAVPLMAAAQTPDQAALDKVAFLMDWIPTGEHAAYYAGW